MRERGWVAASPPPAWQTLHSLPANLATAMVLLDYAAHGLTTPTPWPHAALRHLPAGALERLRRLRTVLAHGTVLREFVLDRLEPGHAAHQDWEAFRRWLETLDTQAVERLIADGIVAGLAYYRIEMEPLPAVEALLTRLGTREPGLEELAEPAARRLALEALFASWGARSPDGPLALALDPPAFQAHLVDFLTDLWKHAFAASWHAAGRALAEAAARAGPAGGERAPRAAADLILHVTGLQPPVELEGALRRSNHLLFVPCLHLGRYLSVTRAGWGWAPAGAGPDRYRVFYEPPALREPGAVAPGREHDGEAVQDGGTARAGEAAEDGPAPGVQVLDLGHLGPALEALGDATRVAMLRLLRREGEMFAGQVAAALGIHPSTVSRHFAQLEAAGLVRARREGSVKYYRLDRERLRAVARLLEHELG